MPASIEPMKATIAERVPRGEDWLFEVKWDGVRAVAFVDNEEVRLQARSGLRCERQYPELAVMPHHIAASQAVLDGEIAVLDAKGVSQFHLIQPRIANTDPNTIAHLVRSTPVIYFAFDLLYLDGYDLRNVALDKRRELLEQVLTPGPAIRISDAFPGAGEALLEAARENGLEGIVAKQAAQRLRIAAQPRVAEDQDRQRAGVRDRRASRSRRATASISARWCWALQGRRTALGGQRRVPASTRNCWPACYARLEPLITKKCPFAERPKPDRGMTWVKPELVCQVKYANWTPDDRLRAPVFIGLRNDVRQCSRAEVSAREDPRHGAELAGQLLPGSPKEATLTIDGHALKFTNLTKLYYPDDGVTKRDVLNYYAAVADLILPLPEGPPALAQALPQRDQGAVLLPEGHARYLSRLAAHRTDRRASITCSPTTTPACCTWSTWGASITTRG